MIVRIRGVGRAPWVMLAAGMAAWVFSGPAGRADDGPSAAGTCPMGHKNCTAHRKTAFPAAGTLGYGPPGLYPGFQGFGLGYRLGYGYGGDGLGPGAEGGYPFYGGPGYPHPWPALRRLGGINPFPYFGGPGYPTPSCPNYYGPTGPLAPDQPVVFFEPDPLNPGDGGGYGGFEGMIPYPESTFAPSVTIAAAGGSASGVTAASPPNAPPNTAPAPGEMLNETSPILAIGIDAVPVAEPGGARGLKVIRLYPGGLAARAGLLPGDLILSINGRATERPGHLAWIVANAAPDKILRMSVRRGSDGAIHPITAQLP